MSLQKFARIIANCPEKTPKLCVDDIPHPVSSYLETLKFMMPVETYEMTGFDYIKRAPFDGTLIVSHDENSINTDVQCKFGDLVRANEEFSRAGTISADSTGRVSYNNSSTLKQNEMGWFALKSLKCVSKDEKSVTLVGYGSSTSTEKYHCGTNIKKVFTKTGNDSFNVETYLDGKKAYVCDYKQRQG